MNDDHLEAVIAADPRMRGRVQVDPRDYLPLSEPQSTRPYGWIVNTDTSDLPGTHWVAVFIPKDADAPAEYFDSYGMPPATRDIRQFLAINSPPPSNHSSRYTCNTVVLQDYDTSTCGYWALWFLRERFRHKSMAQIVAGARQFCSPDCTVYRLVNRAYASSSLPRSVVRNIFPCAERACRQSCQPRRRQR